METPGQREIGQSVNGIQLDLEGFQALAAVADDGRINVDLHHRHGKACATVERLLSSMAEHESEIEHEGQIDVEKKPPNLNIVIQIVGSRGDVQPFVALGIQLQEFGHRVRIATHPPFKNFVENAGLEFFSIGGDPKEMMTYMVKHPGLLPHCKSTYDGEVHERRRTIQGILESCWLSCFIAGDNLDSIDNVPTVQKKPFVANAIIANPPSFAHIHCAEKLGVPLHMMFTTETLDLMPVDVLSASAAVSKFQVPFTYCWSPSLIPKPVDWGPLISISGSYHLQPPVHYTPPYHLIEFLERFPGSIYIGFGSIMLEDADKMTRLLLKAIQKAGVSAVIHKGWAGLGCNVPEPLPEVLFIDDCPHGWIFRRVSCVVHHGGAGTTAAAVAAGKPSIIIPFFGDQPFWAEMVAMAGAGPPPIAFKNLTADRVAHAIRVALTPQVSGSAIKLGMRVAKEDGVANGVDAFHKQLSRYKMECSIFPSRVATWKVRETSISLSSFAASVLMENDVFDLGFIEPKASEAVGIALYSAVQLLQGVKELGTFMPNMLANHHVPLADSKPPSRSRLKSGITGLGQISHGVVKAPIDAAVAITQAIHNTPRLWGGVVRENEPCVTGIASGLKAGSKVIDPFI
ncbi:hypothetical protein N7510_008119 [Penicillium lagena]|uniref:uncharacterized protein n=1 Tax=Penicillium lagena TaxID=94218 RepID=UPI002540D77A|nr:uncharacterized protein N7510_008119 [Penicillium lagena]KAJ5611400.1 hypothetical protein N7510_008119 [Penicillium lagena]